MLPLLNAVSCYSLMRGVHTPETICRQAARSGYRTICITDRNNLYGYPLFLDACSRYGLTPIAGAEVDDGTESALLYADGTEGFSSLCAILSERHLAETFSLGTSLHANSTGITVVTDSPALYRQCSPQLQTFFRVQRLRRLPEWVRKEGVPVLLVPPVVFIDGNDRATHRMLRAIELHATLSRLPESELYPDDALLRSPEDLAERFEIFDEAARRTVDFAASLTPCSRPETYIMPEFREQGQSEQVLKERTMAGALRRYGTIEGPVQQRIDYELSIINSKGFAGYFLIVDDIVRQSPRTCGRGSGAASIVAYALGITNVDPIRYNLLFERFLNASRDDPPDIDIDFAWDERDKVLEYVFKRYGKQHTAMVATHQTCGARMAIREVARVYGRTESEISSVTKKIPWFADLESYSADLEKLLHAWPALREVNLEPPWPDILRDAGAIIGLPRGIGTHCGGVVITSGPVQNVAPLQRSAKGYQILQWEKDGTEAMGLVKIDLLGNRSLAVIRDAVRSVKREFPTFDETRIDPQSDPSTMRLLAEGRSMGVFYVESPAMRLLQRKSRRGDFEHLVIHSSIIRPAANKYIREYLHRLNGKPYTPLHPLIGKALDESYGIMVYQEDVSKVAVALAGFSPEEADRLRKIVTKKAGTETFEQYRGRFYAGARQKGVADTVIDQVWEMICSFQGYSFCKPHSASYVQVSFQSAWLKAHHPAHFMAAVLSNYGGFYTTQAYISEAMRMGLVVRPPDVNRSDVAYTASGREITVGLCQIKGLSSDAAETVVEERRKGGWYRSIAELIDRTALTEDDAEKLLLAGATDAIDGTLNRSRHFWELRHYFRKKQGGSTPPELKPYSAGKLIRLQYCTLGYLTDRHPITLVARSGSRPPDRASGIDAAVGKKVTLYGWCVTAKTVSTATGAAMEFVTFEDETGIFETVFFPDVYSRFAGLLSMQSAFIVKGNVTEEFGVAVVEVETIVKL